ncbi:MAG TPA: FKBP-type peptidyl-prolyl cis-trans isomerase [Tepidisphaeraceae bacterium]|nr:FKBP-type peptidyl-prolyl cis-trans isomerase [Tepidisphaeraceae bacterium]
MRRRILNGIGWMMLAATSVAAAPATQPAGDEHTTPSGLKIVQVRQIADALVAQPGDQVWVHYTGRLESNGQKFDSSFDRLNRQGSPVPIDFRLGAGQVIKGWDEGIAGMKVGEKRKLIIPPDLAYGAQGTPGGPIPPNATLVFDVELVGIYRAEK